MPFRYTQLTIWWISSDRQQTAAVLKPSTYERWQTSPPKPTFEPSITQNDTQGFELCGVSSDSLAAGCCAHGLTSAFHKSGKFLD